MRTSTAAAILFLLAFLVAAFGGSPVAARPPAKRSAVTPAKSTQQADNLPYAPCSTADVMAMLGKGGPLQLGGKTGTAEQKATQEAAKLIQARIAACKYVISQYISGLSPAPIIARNPPGLPPLPTPSPLTTSPPGCIVNVPRTHETNDKPLRLYSALSYCVSWIASNVPSPPASGTPTPQPITLHTPFSGSTEPWSKSVYVLALASDPAQSAQIALQLANNLRAPAMRPEATPGPTPTPQADIYSDRLVRYVVVAAPTWKLTDYQQQCFNDPSTAGAIVAVQPGTQSSAWNFFLGSSWTNLNMQLMVLDCEPTNTSYVNNAAYITWLSHVRSGTGKRVFFSYGAALALTGIIFAAKTTKAKTYTFATPKPQPHSTGWYESSYTLTPPWTNESTVVVAAGSALNSLPPFFQASSVDAQTAGAIARILPPLIDDLMWTCTKMRPGDVSFPVPQCYWFNYRPPSRPTQ
jgi:hypothetical protein